MNIVLACDEKFSEHLSVTVASILINSEIDDNFKFYIFNNDFSKSTKEKLLKLKKIKNFEIEFIDLPEDDFTSLPTRLHYKKQIYYRLRIPEYIKEDRVLYLDSDIIVKKSLKNLYNIELENNIMGVIEDISAKEYKEKFNLNQYFNSGVLLIDVNKMREEEISKKCIDYISENADDLLYFDQDALNVILKDRVLFLNIKYNFQVNRNFPDIRKMYKNLNNEIVVLHFVTGDKPWNFGCDINFILKYFYYLFKTPWIKEALRTKIKLLKEIISHYTLM